MMPRSRIVAVDKDDVAAQNYAEDGFTKRDLGCSQPHGPLSYFRVLQRNQSYRFYLISHLCQHTGDWFVHVASLISIERLVPGSATAISILVATRMLPNIFFAFFGGALADAFDRRVVMIVLDCLSAFIVLGYIFALAMQSAKILYVVSFIRASVVAMYEPVTRAIVPLLVPNDMDLKRAVTLNGIAWSITLTLGGMVAGVFAAYFGVEACYIIDSFTYIISASVMFLLKGSYSVAVGAASITSPGGQRGKITKIFLAMTKPVIAFVAMMTETIKYLYHSGFGLLVLMKASGNITWGSADILNVSFALSNNDVATSERIGMLYSAVGLGCVIGPVFANYYTDVARPKTIQLACICALGVISIGWLGIAFSSNFIWLCIFTSVRTFGSAIIWINSTLLLQKLTVKESLGRVLAFDFALTMACDTAMTFTTGILEDSNIAKEEIALGAAAVVTLLGALWSVFHVVGGGAAKSCFNNAHIEGVDPEQQNVHGPI